MPIYIYTDIFTFLVIYKTISFHLIFNNDRIRIVPPLFKVHICKMVAISKNTTMKENKKEEQQPIICDKSYNLNKNTTFLDSKLKKLLFLVIGVATGCVIASVWVISLLIIRGISSPCVNEELLNSESIMWTDENIAYWSSVDPVAPLDPNDEEGLRKYEEAFFLKQEARLRGLKCIPKKGVFNVQDLLKEERKSEELLDLLIPDQKVVLNRCLPQSSYCPVYGSKCTPTKDVRQGYKRIAVIIKNGTLGEEEVAIAIHVKEHVHCSCQCLYVKDDV